MVPEGQIISMNTDAVSSFSTRPDSPARKHKSIMTENRADVSSQTLSFKRSGLDYNHVRTFGYFLGCF